ncbi:hypothetical protein RUM44_012375 [Polyplax serrata]|uniref:C2H2-type domain-containing protein n=1 Tax=Polyplax serrata TaxID=468196 RepID=A0ABR1BB45_POLSC
MDNVRYMCFCKSVFPTLNSFERHVTCCEHLRNTPDLNSEQQNCGAVPPIEDSDENVKRSSDFNKFNLIKSWAVVMDHEESPNRMATNLWGRKLPRRTKVPYLTRAVPLSTDHSYESCKCGAVFVTRMGKRQHQARFCKFGRNKEKRDQKNDIVNVAQRILLRELTSTNNVTPRERYLSTYITGEFQTLEKSSKLLNTQKLSQLELQKIITDY